MNRVAEVLYEGPAWIYKMFITFIVAVVVIGIVGVTLVNNINTREVQKSLLLYRILYSPDGFWYTENELMTPGVIDDSKFDQTRLDQSFHYPDNYGGAHLILEGGGQRQERYINEPTFNDLKTQFEIGTVDRGSFETHHYPVLIKYPDKEVNGWLTVEIAMPEST